MKIYELFLHLYKIRVLRSIIYVLEVDVDDKRIQFNLKKFRFFSA